MAEETTPRQILEHEVQHLETVAQHEGDQALVVRARAYQITRTVYALFSYVSTLVPEQHRESADDAITYLKEQQILDEDALAALSELVGVADYFLDVTQVDIDFVAEIVAYTDTYMQAIKAVCERLENVNSITDVEDNGGTSEK